jgi:hypothetical protein
MRIEEWAKELNISEDEILERLAKILARRKDKDSAPHLSPTQTSDSSLTVELSHRSDKVLRAYIDKAVADNERTFQLAPILTTVFPLLISQPPQTTP